MTVDDTLRQAADLVAAGASSAGFGLALRVHQALQVAAAGDPDVYVAARDRLATHLGQPVTAWVLDHHIDTPVAVAACAAAAHPVLQLVSGGDR